jgi:hypothetical protein
VPAEAEEFVYGPANPASVPFKELDNILNYDVANIAYDYFLDPEDFFYMSIRHVMKRPMMKKKTTSPRRGPKTLSWSSVQAILLQFHSRN